LLVGLEAPQSLVGGEIASGLVRLSRAAPSAGVKVHLQSGSSAIQVPSSVTIPAGQTVGSFAISTTPVTTTVTRSFEATLQGRSLQRSISLSPGGLSSLTLNPANVTSGVNSTGTIRLTGSAPSGGVSVSLTYNSGVLSGPANVTVPAGQEAVSFHVQTSYVSSRVTRSITAIRGTVSRIANITIAPAYDLVVNPSTVQSGQNTTARVTIPNAAPSGGLSVPVTSNSSALVVPQSVMIPAGEYSVLFTIGTRPVSTSVGRYVTVTYNGLNKSALVTITPYSNLATLTVNPSTVKGGQNTTGTVTLDLAAPSDGAVVNLSSSTSYIVVPANVTVPAGQTSVSFTITTKSVGAAFTRSISATRAGVTRAANITLTP
ncbi:MAG TPA: hypothetical protein VEX38_03440, partial [Fimbriimonadaceae bacterium]|nr:hypothetical protein [Fimbriimonadaceae bacterium]